MKIGILTFHDGVNHGAFFQVYGLYKSLKSLGCNVEIINYKNFRHWVAENRIFLITKNPFILLQNFIKIVKFRRGLQKFCMTKFSFSLRKVGSSY